MKGRASCVCLAGSSGTKVSFPVQHLHKMRQPTSRSNAGDGITSNIDAASSTPVSSRVTFGSRHDDKHNTIQTRDKFSWQGIFMTAAIILGGTIAILLAVAYLTFIWFSDIRNTAWHMIILSNWTTTSVAICGVVIRWATSFQLVLFTSVLALNLLRNGTSLSKIPRISTLRFTNGGPLDFLLLLERPGLNAHSIHLFSVIVLLMFISVMLQLTSTLLLSDLAASPISMLSNMTNNAILAGYDSEITTGYNSDPLKTTSPSYPLFAELSSLPPANSDGSVDDTGPSIRALLPSTVDDGRSRLLSFEGNASLYDARWICTRPLLSDLKFTGNFRPERTTYLSGRVNHSIYYPPMFPGSPDPPPSFNCSLGQTLGSHEWTVITSNMHFDNSYVLQGVVNSLDNTPNHTKDSFRQVGGSWLVVNVTALNISSALPEYDDECYARWLAFNNSDQFVVTPNGQWASITSTQQDSIFFSGRGNGTDKKLTSRGNWTFRLDASICSSAFTFTKNMYIKAQRAKAVEEPTVANTGAKQIGATKTHYAIEDRGILILDETEYIRQMQIEHDTLAHSAQLRQLNPISRLVSTTNSNQDRAWFLTEGVSCDTITNLQDASCPMGVNEDRVGLFQSIIQNTNSPALAMQAMQHTLITDRYYRYMPNFRAASVQSITLTTDAIQPVRMRGYIAVVSAICAHFILVVNILLVFGVFCGTKQTLSSIDQAWQVFSQVAILERKVSAGYDREDTLCSTTATDHQIEQNLRDRGIKGKVYFLDGVSDESSVVFRPLNKSVMVEQDISLREMAGDGRSSESGVVNDTRNEPRELRNALVE